MKFIYLRRAIPLAFCGAAFSGCNSSGPHHRDEAGWVKAGNKISDVSKISKTQIQGTWTFNNHDRDMAAICIYGDSIQYLPEGTKYSYYLQGDSITITYPDEIFTGQVFLSDDTLVLTDRSYGVVHYYRWKASLK